MIPTPLIIWFLPLLFIGGVAAVASGLALCNLVQHRRKKKQLNCQEIKELNREIENNFNSNNYSTVNLKDFVAKEDGIVYSGKYDTKTTNLTNVLQIDYETIDNDLNRELNNLDDDKVLLI